jgi:multimeric flavodoxin WrbA
VSKKVLVLSASPRKGGNSDLLCDQFMLGAKEAGNQAEKIFLRDKKINYCVGCLACQSNVEYVCKTMIWTQFWIK